jgi:hypothetical protein
MPRQFTHKNEFSSNLVKKYILNYKLSTKIQVPSLVYIDFPVVITMLLFREQPETVNGL